MSGIGIIARRFTLFSLFAAAVASPQTVAQQAEPLPANSGGTTAAPQAGTQSRAKDANGQNGGYKISVGVEAVLVPVVVRDRQGRAVANLKKEDFEVFDQGRQRAISGFTIESRAGGESASSDVAVAPALSGGAGPANVAAPTGSLAQARHPRCMVLLFDDMHLDEGDLMRARVVGNKLLATPLGRDEAVAVISMSGGNSGLTQDTGKLRDAVAKLRVKNLYRKIGPECPDVGYLEADRIQNKHDPSALETAVANYFTCSNSQGLTKQVAEQTVRGAASRMLELGDQDVRVSLGFVAEVVRRMSTLPGQRTLVLVSPGFLTMTPESMSAKSVILNMAAQANVTISALDARGVYTTEINADQRGARSALALMNGSDQDYHRETEERSGNILAEMADGTGGTYFHGSNDLAGGLRQLVAGPEYLYVLEFPLDQVKHDGAYHTLSVKVNRPSVNVQARHGYFAPAAERRKK